MCTFKDCPKSRQPTYTLKQTNKACIQETTECLNIYQKTLIVKTLFGLNLERKKSLSCDSCHLTTTLCSFSCYESPRRFGVATAGSFGIDRVIFLYLNFL